MPLTDLQEERIMFHLREKIDIAALNLERTLVLRTLNATQELSVIGNIDTALDEECFFFESVKLCTLTSQLGRVEKAYAKLDSDIIDDSLFVSQAGSVKLRGNETQQRDRLYRRLVQFLGTYFGYPSTTEGGRASLCL